jgi:hypothetical protein
MRGCAGATRARLASAALAALLVCTDASADPIAVEVMSCTLQVAELERLVRLELSSVLEASDNPGAYRVSLACEGGEVRIAIHDPLTGKRVERSVVAPPPDQPEPERALALAVAQLYRASWLELVTEDVPPLPPARPVAEPREAVERAIAEVKPKLPVIRERRDWSLGVAGGARVRHLQSPLVLPHLAVHAAYWPTERMWILAGGGVEWASPARANGTVDALLLHAGAGFGIEPLHAGAWSGFAELGAGFSYVRVEGSDARAGFATGTAAGGGFDGSLALGAAWSPEPIRIELLGLAGLLAGTPAGLVDGDDAVSLDGAWAAVELRLRWML